MTEKRYAIVRVDNRCPVEEEEDICLVDRIKMFPCFNDKRLSCKKCKYGDTKEQLIRKVEQGIIIASKKKQIYIANPKAFSKEVSKIIVEFLGVE